MIMNIKRHEYIETIQKLLNIDKKLAEKIYDEAGTNIDKIYASLRTIKTNNINVNGKTYSKCLRCGRALKTPESRMCGYGSVCKDKVSKSTGKLRKKSFISEENYGTYPRTTRFGGEKH